MERVDEEGCYSWDDGALGSDVWAEGGWVVPSGKDESSGIRIPTDPDLSHHTRVEATVKVQS